MMSGKSQLYLFNGYFQEYLLSSDTFLWETEWGQGGVGEGKKGRESERASEWTASTLKSMKPNPPDHEWTRSKHRTQPDFRVGFTSGYSG